MLNSFLTRMGIMSKEAPSIAIWGIDISEMTSLVYTLKSGKYIKGTFSVHPFVEKITTNKLTFTATVPSGHEACRRSFRPALPDFDGIVCLVDVMDSESFFSSKAELDNILADQEILKPILVLVPKPDVATEETIMQELCLGEAIAKANGRVALFSYSLSSAQLKGYDEGLRWLLEQL